jgi:hypothetical protein
MRLSRYLPDMAPLNFFLFSKLKTALIFIRFDDVETAEHNAVDHLLMIPKNFF